MGCVWSGLQAHKCQTILAVPTEELQNEEVRNGPLLHHSGGVESNREEASWGLIGNRCLRLLLSWQP